MSRIHATYRIRAAEADIEAVAEALALEQSVETPRDVAVRDAFVRDEILARVEAIRSTAPDVHEVTLALAVATTGFDVAQTLNMLFGNSSLHAHMELVDAVFPAGFSDHFARPRFGIAGLRRLTGVADRPLACGALKPQGLPVEALAELCYSFALGGVDFIKDDHGLADQAYSPFAARVRACQRAVQRANRETGRNVIYAPSMVGSPQALTAQARLVREEGVGAVLIAPALVGLPVFHELVATQLQVPVLAHPAYAGATRVAPALLLGKLFRLLGADAVIYPNYGGRFAYTRDECGAIAAAARSPWGDMPATMPVPAGGMNVGRVEEMIEFYGMDVMLLIGGSLLQAGNALPDRTREFVARVAHCAGQAPIEGASA